MDREKIIMDNAVHGLQSAIEISGSIVHLRKECAKAILELLKKQEPMNVVETPKDRMGVPEKSCPKCNIPIYTYVYGMGYLGEIKYCPWCGQAVNWLKGSFK